MWMSIDKAIRLLEKDNPQEYTSKFMRKRDLAFLYEAKKLLKNEKTYKN